MLTFLLVTGIIFVIIGVRGLLWPAQAVAELFQLKVEGVDGYSHLRATGGGVTIAAGAVMMAANWVAALVGPALVLVLVMLGGLFCGRVYSLVADGKPSGIVWFSWSMEVLGLLQGVFWSLMKFA